MKLRRKPVVLIVRDGWGANPHKEWDKANAIHLGKTPVDERLMSEYPHVQIHTSGTEVGLPNGVMGNSEVGHQNIGAGRIVEQEVMRITGRIEDGSFFKNEALVAAFRNAREKETKVHLMGLCSDGRVHSDLEHLYALMEMSKRMEVPGDRVFVHAFMDGRDTPPQSGIGYMEQIEKRCSELGINPVASVIGRFYAMDRDNRWGRVEKAYRMLVHGEGERFMSAVQALRQYYRHPSEKSCSGDEFVLPSVIAEGDQQPVTFEDGDSVIFFNFRGDRPRELTQALSYDEFPFEGTGKDGYAVGFERGDHPDIHMVTMTRYAENLPVQVAFEKPPRMANILGSYLADLNLEQFRCAETEKYPHVTFFFNDYRDERFHNEERELVPSPRDISTYDQKPEMSAYQVTDVILRRLESYDDDVLVINYANGDMVGHTGVLEAAIKAVETVDECVGKVVASVQKKGGSLIITADHGNCEQMIDPRTGGPHTAHTTYDVELIVADDGCKGQELRTGGRLADIAPTMLALLGVDKPEEMTGESLLEQKPD